jgi:hypothetical protein
MFVVVQLELQQVDGVAKSNLHGLGCSVEHLSARATC